MWKGENPPVSFKFCKTKNDLCNKDDVITPLQQDTLVWCCYVLLNGNSAYNYIMSMNGNTHSIEFDLKKHLVDLIIKEPKKIKTHCNHKMTKIALEEIKSNLMTGINLKIPELIAFCVYYNKCIMVIFDNKCYMIINGMGVSTLNEAEKIEEDETPSAIFYYNSKNKKYSISFNCSLPLIIPEIEKMVKIEQYTKPIYGLSNYKTIELEKIYNKLIKITDEQTQTLTTSTKKEMYEIIYKTLAVYIGI